MSRIRLAFCVLVMLVAPVRAQDVPQYNWTTERVANVNAAPLSISHPEDIDVSPADELYVFVNPPPLGGSERVVVLDSSFQLVRQWPLGCAVPVPGYIAVGATRVVVGAPGCSPLMRAFLHDGTSAGNFVTAGSGTGQTQQVGGIDVDSAENTYVYDTIGKKVVVYSVSNVFVREFPVCAGGSATTGFSVSSARQEVWVNCVSAPVVYTLTGTPKTTSVAFPSSTSLTATGEFLALGGGAAGTHINMYHYATGANLISGPRMAASVLAIRDRDVVYGLLPSASPPDVLSRAVRTFRSAIPSLASRIPLPTILSAKARTGTTIFDVDYQVSDPDSATVTVVAVAYPLSGGTLFPATFVEGTAVNAGPGVATNTVKRLSWDAKADFPSQNGFLDVQFGVIASDGRPLLEVQFIDLDRTVLREPSGVADCGTGTLRISRSPFMASEINLAWIFLVANGDPGLSVQNSQVFGVSGPYAGQLLGSRDIPFDLGRAFLLDRLGFREATADEVACAYEGTTAGRQGYPATAIPLAKKLYSLDAAAVVNEVGLDVASQAPSFWVVDP